MRTIKFRGKRISDNKTIYGDYLSPNTVREYHDLTDLSNYSDWLVDPNTIGQFTGLLDKNGKEIYEGDNLRYFKGSVKSAYDNLTGTVDWKDGGFRLIFKDRKPIRMYCFESRILMSGIYELTIIGNIHEQKQ